MFPIASITRQKLLKLENFPIFSLHTGEYSIHLRIFTSLGK